MNQRFVKADPTSSKAGERLEHSERAELAAGLVRLVALHDGNTATHLRASGTLARRIAEQMKVPTDVAERIELAALLHDIGKINVRREILSKRGELSPTEWDEMRLHPGNGAAALEDIPELAHLAPIVRAHHERMDGCGYPDRLRGDEIPLEARFVAVADAFHALTTDRPYRSAISPTSALSVLACAAGPQFDTDVVAATLTLFANASPSSRLSA